VRQARGVIVAVGIGVDVRVGVGVRASGKAVAVGNGLFDGEQAVRTVRSVNKVVSSFVA